LLQSEGTSASWIFHQERATGWTPENTTFKLENSSSQTSSNGSRLVAGIRFKVAGGCSSEWQLYQGEIAQPHPLA
jgi:hypothetical protein